MRAEPRKQKRTIRTKKKEERARGNWINAIQTRKVASSTPQTNHFVKKSWPTKKNRNHEIDPREILHDFPAPSDTWVDRDGSNHWQRGRAVRPTHTMAFPIQPTIWQCLTTHLWSVACLFRASNRLRLSVFVGRCVTGSVLPAFSRQAKSPNQVTNEIDAGRSETKALSVCICLRDLISLQTNLRASLLGRHGALSVEGLPQTGMRQPDPNPGWLLSRLPRWASTKKRVSFYYVFFRISNVLLTSFNPHPSHEPLTWLKRPFFRMSLKGRTCPLRS